MRREGLLLVALAFTIPAREAAAQACFEPPIGLSLPWRAVNRILKGAIRP
jgi:hypothetical protein